MSPEAIEEPVRTVTVRSGEGEEEEATSTTSIASTTTTTSFWGCRVAEVDRGCHARAARWHHDATDLWSSELLKVVAGARLAQRGPRAVEKLQGNSVSSRAAVGPWLASR